MLITQQDLREHWPAMVRAAQAIVGTRDDAEECAATALAQACERDMPVDNLQAFLVTVAKRRAIDLHRRRERECVRDLRLRAQCLANTSDIADDVVARAEARWVDSFAQELLRPHVYRVVRRVADGAAVGDVAREMGMSQRAVESHLLRARRLVRQAVGSLAALVIFVVSAGRKGAPKLAPVIALAASVAVLAIPFTDGPPKGAPRLVVPVAPEQAASQRTAPEVLQHLPATDRRETRATRGPTPMPARLAGRSESDLITVVGPADSTASVTHGDTGEAEETPVEVILACLRDFQVSPSQIGCSGPPEAG